MYKLKKKKRDLTISSHHVGTVFSKNISKLTDSQSFINFIHKAFSDLHIQNLGVLTHVFENNSFSVVIMLTESHISVHTWPERNSVQLDVFLCNYIHDNSKKGKDLFDKMVKYFEPEERFVSTIERQ